VPQLVLYLRGVGSTGMLAQRLVEGAVGLGVDDNIRSGYMRRTMRPGMRSSSSDSPGVPSRREASLA